jgi:diadenosine tetraphosphatase ApaH/serine/threonine PP2A family protein phosphatase
MRCAIIADIHANLAALAAVLADIKQKGGVDELWCLGDMVGYGPDPHQCLELLRQLNHVGVVGNHDLAAIGKVETTYFNADAVAAIQWTAKQLTPGDIRYLENLPMKLEMGDFTLVHGSPMEPVWEYLISTGIAARNFAYFSSRFCLVGHTHIPATFKKEKGTCHSIGFSPGIGIVLGEDRMIINPGGVGQPRDGDPRASYAIYDSEGKIMRLYRVPYDIGATQDKMMKAKLPIHLVTRLQEGR